jgi:hypothetical protein
MIVAGITFVVGSIFLRESHNVKIWDEVTERDTDNEEIEIEGAA